MGGGVRVEPLKDVKFVMFDPTGKPLTEGHFEGSGKTYGYRITDVTGKKLGGYDAAPGYTYDSHTGTFSEIQPQQIVTAPAFGYTERGEEITAVVRLSNGDYQIVYLSRDGSPKSEIRHAELWESWDTPRERAPIIDFPNPETGAIAPEGTLESRLNWLTANLTFKPGTNYDENLKSLNKTIATAEANLSWIEGNPNISAAHQIFSN